MLFSSRRFFPCPYGAAVLVGIPQPRVARRNFGRSDHADSLVARSVGRSSAPLLYFTPTLPGFQESDLFSSWSVVE